MCLADTLYIVTRSKQLDTSSYLHLEFMVHIVKSINSCVLQGATDHLVHKALYTIKFLIKKHTNLLV